MLDSLHTFENIRGEFKSMREHAEARGLDGMTTSSQLLVARVDPIRESSTKETPSLTYTSLLTYTSSHLHLLLLSTQAPSREAFVYRLRLYVILEHIHRTCNAVAPCSKPY